MIHPGLNDLLLARAPLILKVVYNYLVFLGQLGPLDAMDCFLDDHHRRILLRLIWASLQLAQQNYKNLTWAASVPYRLAATLTSTWSINMDGFSDIFNNSFTLYTMDPDSKFTFMAPFVDVFKVLTAVPVFSALCNPPFSPILIAKFIAAVRQRIYSYMDTNIVYIGPPHPDLSTLYHHGLAIRLATFPPHALPFVHALRGILPGFPKHLQLWWLGNVQWPPTSLIFKSLCKIRRSYPLQIDPQFYERCLCRVDRRMQINSHYEWLQQCRQPLADLLSNPGQLQWHNVIAHHQNMQQAARFLPIVQRLQLKLPTIQWNFNLNMDGYSCVYVIICIRCKLIYVGSTIQTPWHRLRQHWSDARRHRHFQTRSSTSWRSRLRLHDHMVIHGLENSVMYILDALPGCHEDRIRKLEWRIMYSFARQQLLNDRVPHSGRVAMSKHTLAICRQGIYHLLSHTEYAKMAHAMETFGIRELVNKIITSQRISFDARTLLMLHQHLNCYFDPHSGTLANYRVCMLKRLRLMGMTLPAHLMLRVPQLTTQEAPRIRALITRHILSVPNHPWIQQYYLSRLQLVKGQVPPLGNTLHNCKSVLRHLTWPKLNRIINTPAEQCACARLGAHLPRVKNHVIFRPGDLTGDPIPIGGAQLSTENICALQQNMRGIPRLSPQGRWSLLRPELNQLCRRIAPKSQIPSDLISDIYHALKADDITEHGTQILCQARAALSKLQGCICGPLDKNPSGIWVCCRIFYLQILHQDYLSTAGLGGFRMISSTQTAVDLQVQHLTSYGFLTSCRGSALRHLRQHEMDTIPALYILIKNKTFPIVENVVKTRPITSHYRHPFRTFARHCTRGLSLLLKHAHQALGPTLSLMCLTTSESTQFWDRAMQRYASVDHQFLQLFEYDLDSMYYHIPQAQCMAAINQFFGMFRTVFKRRNVAICRQHRVLDRIGCGSRELYVNISIDTLLRFCEYELYGNSIARAGHITYQQTLGLPMGGIPSAPIANIFLLMQEINNNALYSSRNFWFFRYLDNLPGIYDVRTTTLTSVENCLRNIYCMPMKLESTGSILDTLELRVIISHDGLQYYQKPMLHDLMIPAVKGIDPSIQRIPPQWCSNRKSFLGFYLPSALLKCVRHASSLLGLTISVRNLVLGLLKHGFSLATLLTFIKQFCFIRNIGNLLFHIASFLLQQKLDLYPA